MEIRAKGIAVYLDDSVWSVTTMPRLLIFKFTPIYAVQVFVRTNPNASRNRLWLFRGSGLLSIRPLLVLAQPTNGLWVCRMTYIQNCLRLLFVSQCAGLLAFAGKFFHSSTVWAMFLAIWLEIVSFLHATNLFVCYRFDDTLDVFNVYTVGSDDCQVKQLKQELKLSVLASKASGTWENCLRAFNMQMGRVR